MPAVLTDTRARKHSCASLSRQRSASRRGGAEVPDAASTSKAEEQRANSAAFITSKMDDEREREVIDKLQRLETTVQHKYSLLDKLSEENSLKELELADKRRNLRSRIGLLALVQDGAALDTTIREVEEHSSKLKFRKQELEKAIESISGTGAFGAATEGVSAETRRVTGSN